jgi:hypothetical protein
LGTRGAEHNNGSTFIGNRDGEQVELAVYQWAAFSISQLLEKKCALKKFFLILKKNLQKLFEKKVANCQAMILSMPWLRRFFGKRYNFAIFFINVGRGLSYFYLLSA